jgi:hypothetical protein
MSDGNPDTKGDNAFNDPNFAPKLEQIWATAPPVPDDPGASPSGGEGGPPAPPVRIWFDVHTGSIRDVESSLLAETRSQVDHYESLKAEIHATGPMAKPVAWAMTTGEVISGAWRPQGYGWSEGDSKDFPHDNNEPGGQAFETSDGEERLLLATADTITLVGRYVAALNDAAQAYAHADINSRPPAP